MKHDRQALAVEFGKATPQVVDEMNRQAEAYLSAQLTTALASDQRALVFSSILGGVLAILISLIASEADGTYDAARLLHTTVPMIACFVVALCLALFACRPVDWRPPGNNPKNWLDDIKSSQSLDTSKAETTALYVIAIEENHSTMRRHTFALSTSMVISGIGLVIGITVFLWTAF